MKSFAEVHAAFPAAVRERYSFSAARYLGALVRIEGVVCPEHGEFSQYAAQFRKGRGCPQCGAVERTQAKRTPAQEYFEKVAEIHAGKYDYSASVFTKMNALITIRCPEHGPVEVSANHHYYRKQGCGVCATEARREHIVQYRHLSSQGKIANTARDFFARCAEAHDGKYSYPEQEYRGAKEKIRVVCPAHGEFQQAAWAHLSGKGCFACGASDPKWERELYAFLTGMGFDVQRSAPVLGKRHIDLFIPAAQVGIELHGLRWHTAKHRDRLYHRQKWEAAQAAGIRLLQVFEDEWGSSADIVRARIAAVLGRAEKFDARKLSVVTLAPERSKAFLLQHHIQGPVTARRHYGLQDADGRLLAVATFGPSRSGAMVGAQSEGAWEVLRYASVGRVRGGFTRLLARFLRDVQPSAVISYCDLRYGDGRLYQAAGFTLAGVTEPDYWWVPDGRVQRIPRYATQKHKLVTHPVLSAYYSPEKSEVEICEAAGWSKIFGVGNQKWIWTP